MSSVRIGQHNRAAAVPASPGTATAKGELASSGVGFAVALGSATPFLKQPGAVPFGGAPKGTASDADPSRKRSSGAGKGGDAAAMLAAQTALLAVVGQVPVPSHAAVEADPVLPALPAADRQNPGVSSTGQSGADAVTATSGPAVDFAKSLSRPSDAAVAALQPSLLGDDLPATAAADAGNSGSLPGGAGVDPSAALSNVGREIPLTLSSLNPTASPPAAATAAPAIVSVSAGEPATGSDNAATGREDRERSSLAPSNVSRAADAALGVSGDPTALTNIPTAAMSAPAGADAAATVADQVANHVVQLVSSGSREMVMRLHPPELGEVTVRVAVDGRDVSAWFGTPQPHVQVALADGLGQLQAGLGNAGYNLNGAWVGADASGSRPQAGNPPPPSGAFAPPSGRGAQMPAVSRPPAPGLNIYV